MPRVRNRGVPPTSPTRPYSPRLSVAELESTFTRRTTTQRKLEVLRREVKKRALNETFDEYIYAANYSTTAARLKQFDAIRANDRAAAKTYRRKHRAYHRKREIKQLRVANKDLSDQIEELDEANEALASDYDNILAEKEILRQGQQSAQDRMAALQAQVTTLQAQPAPAALPTAWIQYDSLRQQNSERTQEMNQLLKQQITYLEEAAIESAADIATLQRAAQVAQAQITALQTHPTRARVAALEAQLAAMTNDRDDHRDERHRLDDEVTRLEDGITELQDQINRLRNQVFDQDGQLGNFALETRWLTEEIKERKPNWQYPDQDNVTNLQWRLIERLRARRLQVWEVLLKAERNGEVLHPESEVMKTYWEGMGESSLFQPEEIGDWRETEEEAEQMWAARMASEGYVGAREGIQEILRPGLAAASPVISPGTRRSPRLMERDEYL